MTDIEFASGFAHETAPDLTRKVMLDAAEYTTLDDLAALLATSGDVAKGLTTVETLSASGTWGDAAIMITDAASTLTLTMPTIPTLAAGQAMRRFLVVLPSAHPVNPVAAGGQTYHGATGITDDGTYSVVEMIAINNDGDLEWTGVQLTTGAQLAGLSAFCSGLSGDLTAHTGSTSNPHAVTAAQAGAVSATGHTAKSAIVADASGNVVDLTPSTTDRLLGWASSAIAWIQITLGMIPDSLITLPKLADAAAHTILTRSANSTGAVAAQSVGTDEGLFNVAGVLTSQKAQTANIADAAITGAKIVQSGTIDVGSASITTTGGVTSSLLKSGAGSPEGAATAGVGAIYRDTTNGSFYIKRTGTGNTGWVLIDQCSSSTYTPTATLTLNLDSATPSVFRYTRVGDVVWVSGDVSLDPTASGTISFDLSLPIASALSASSQVTGNATNPNSGNVGRVLGEATNDRAQITMGNVSTSAYTVAITFSYQVI